MVIFQNTNCWSRGTTNVVPEPIHPQFRGFFLGESDYLRILFAPEMIFSSAIACNGFIVRPISSVTSKISLVGGRLLIGNKILQDQSKYGTRGPLVRLLYDESHWYRFLNPDIDQGVKYEEEILDEEAGEHVKVTPNRHFLNWSLSESAQYGENEAFLKGRRIARLWSSPESPYNTLLVPGSSRPGDFLCLFGANLKPFIVRP